MCHFCSSSANHILLPGVVASAYQDSALLCVSTSLPLDSENLLTSSEVISAAALCLLIFLNSLPHSEALPGRVLSL